MSRDEEVYDVFHLGMTFYRSTNRRSGYIRIPNLLAPSVVLAAVRLGRLWFGNRSS